VYKLQNRLTGFHGFYYVCIKTQLIASAPTNTVLIGDHDVQILLQTSDYVASFAVHIPLGAARNEVDFGACMAFAFDLPHA
jgi:hypothetical protein